MAAYTQSQSQIEEIRSLLKRRIWQVLTPAVLTGAVGVMAATLLPRKYSASTRLELVPPSLPLQETGLDLEQMKDEVWAADFHIRSFERVRRVIERLEWEDFQSLPPDGQVRYLQRVLANISVSPTTIFNTDTTFLDLEYSDTEPQRAAQLINELRDLYVKEKLQSVRDQAVRLREQLQSHLRDDEASYDQALRSKEELQRQHGISPTQQAPGGGRVREEDPVYARLQAIEQSLTDARGALATSQGTRDQKLAQVEAEPAMVPSEQTKPGVDVEAELFRIDQAILEQRARQDGIRPPHSRYRTAQAEIDRLEAERVQLLEREFEPEVEVRLVPNTKRADMQTEIDRLDAQIAGQVRRIADLETTRERLALAADERSEVYRRLADLDFQLKLAMAAMEETKGEFDRQRRLADVLLQTEFSPFEVTQYAFPPGQPSSPNVPLVVGGGAAIGLALGALFALLAEFGRNGFRGPTDIAGVLPVPVLGVVNHMLTSAQRRTRSLRRALVGTTILLLAGTILWITWAYVKRPSLLGQEFVALLDEVRDSFR